jgi:exonuclease SbcC
VKAEIEKRIGLSFEQFTRAVLLAQNEFSAFLKAEDNERGELLETLTGSTVYSEISMRAFERNKLEQAALQKLNLRLADQKPLTADQRAEMEAKRRRRRGAASAGPAKGRAGAGTALAPASRKTGAGGTGRWQALAAAQAEVAAAAPRHAALALIDGAAGAPAGGRDSPHRWRHRRHASRHRRQHAKPAAGRAGAGGGQRRPRAIGRQPAGSGSRQRAAAPQLDQAKALDARIEAMLPAYRQAAAACEGVASRCRRQGRAAIEAKRASPRGGAAAGRRGVAAAAQALEGAGAAMGALGRAVRAGRPGCGDGGTAGIRPVARAAQRADASRRGSRCQRQAGRRRGSAAIAGRAAPAAAQAMAAYSVEELQASRRSRSSAATCWPARKNLAGTGLASGPPRPDRDAIGAAAAGHDRAEAQVAAAQQEGIAIMAAFSQAERALLAEAACAASVESLRQSLEDDTPCPVCGALDHPYRHNDDSLQNMLREFQADVAKCRQQMEANVNQQAAHRAAQASAEQLNVLAIEQRSVSRRWHRRAVSLLARTPARSGRPAADAERAAWFVAQLAETHQALQAIEQQERALHAARTARDQAQAAYDRAAAEHTRLQTVAAAARTALAQSSTEYKALEDQRIEVALTLSGLLSDLDPAFSGGEMPSEEWKEDWRSGPARFYEARQAESKQWLAYRAAYDERAALLAGFDVELNALNDALAKPATTPTQPASLRRRRCRAEGQPGPAHGHVGRQGSPRRRSRAASRHRQRESPPRRRANAAQQAAQAQVRNDEALAQAGRQLARCKPPAPPPPRACKTGCPHSSSASPTPACKTCRSCTPLLARSADDINAERHALQALPEPPSTPQPSCKNASASANNTCLPPAASRCGRHALDTASLPSANAATTSGRIDARRADRADADRTTADLWATRPRRTPSRPPSARTPCRPNHRPHRRPHRQPPSSPPAQRLAGRTQSRQRPGHRAATGAGAGRRSATARPPCWPTSSSRKPSPSAGRAWMT